MTQERQAGYAPDRVRRDRRSRCAARVVGDAMTEKKHVVKFTHHNRWQCTCGLWGRYHAERAVERCREEAEDHAFLHSGIVEYGNVGSPS